MFILMILRFFLFYVKGNNIMKFSFVIMLILLGVSVPGWSLAAQGDAMPGMAAQGVVRLPHEGMVEQMLRSRGRPGMRRYRNPSINSSRIDTQTKSGSSATKNLQGREGSDDATSEHARPNAKHAQ